MSKVEIYDTTLRDGAQMRGISFSVADKLKVLKTLDELGVSYVEGGWPGANPKDIDFFEEAKKLELKNTTLTAFGSTRRANTKAEEDSILKALLRADTKVVCIVSKSSAWQIEKTLNTSLENNLLMLADSVRYLKENGRRVFVDAEHFFDGYKSNPEYSTQFIETAISAGAEYLVLCDTNGGTLPEYIAELSKFLTDKYGQQIKFGIHAHNDSEVAVANSVSAAINGISQVQGTVNGYGERCGNANLMSIIPNLQLKHGLECIAPEKLSKLTQVSKTIAEIANMNHNPYAAFVGANAFTHKGGLHASAMQKDGNSYEHISPAAVGNNTKIIVSEQSGVSNIINWLSARDIELQGDDEQKKSTAKAILTLIKDKEHEGFSFENAGASLELLIRKFLCKEYQHENLPVDIFPEYFAVMHSDVIIKDVSTVAAQIKIKVGNDSKEVTSSTEHGPAHALDLALRKALLDYYPEINNFQLNDYKVRIQDSHLGTAAITKVQISTGLSPEATKTLLNEGEESPLHKLENGWDTIGVNSNIIKSTWDAIVDSIEYGLYTQNVDSIHYSHA